MGLISRVSSRTYRSKNAYRNLSIFGFKNLPRPWKKLCPLRRQTYPLNQRKIGKTSSKDEKGTMTEIDARKRGRRTIKTQRGVGGQSWAEIQAKKNQKPEIRKAQRENAVLAAKAKKREAADKKKSSRTATKTAKPAKQAFDKNVRAAKPKVG